jgi:hypothetical protein
VRLDPLLGPIGTCRHRALGRQCRGLPRRRLAESIIGLCKTEVIRQRRLLRRPEAVEYTAVDRADRLELCQLLDPIGHAPPAERQAAHQLQAEWSPLGA